MILLRIRRNLKIGCCELQTDSIQPRACLKSCRRPRLLSSSFRSMIVPRSTVLSLSVLIGVINVASGFVAPAFGWKASCSPTKLSSFLSRKSYYGRGRLAKDHSSKKTMVRGRRELLRATIPNVSPKSWSLCNARGMFYDLESQRDGCRPLWCDFAIFLHDSIKELQ